MSDKTKAAMQGRQCHYQKFKQNQVTRVNAGGQSLSAPEITGTAPLARLECHAQNLLHWLGYEAMPHTPNHTPQKPGRSGVADLQLGQPLGSMPCRRSSWRASSFIQLPRLTPSRSAASFSCCRSSGLIRIWKVGDQPSPLGVLSRLIVDTYVRNLIPWVLLCTYVITANIEKATPRTVSAVPGRLTKPLVGVTVMADQQHTQSHPKYTWRFLALNRHDKKAKPCRLSVVAVSESEARSILAPHFILSLAARLPIAEVRNA